ncbi:hypothetical protein [Deinococcus sp.]|uniref:hypothetical protein n=1 Tax=Deinococcus sp. TaxID=47478 RepID=UPI003B5CE23D
MKRPNLLIGLLVVILLACGGLVYLDQTGVLGGAAPASSSSGSATTDDPYGGLK